MCVCVCGQNEFKVCTMVSFSHIHKFIPYYASVYIHTNTHILKPFEDSEPMGLNVDIAKTDDSNTMSIKVSSMWGGLLFLLTQ